ncbi:hypothetical protein ONS96_014516 [Cadophora gregata f. sp. sojae]|nr:hypothetical protein ONS96_014516 [Cadophora gregata f. sp. sojae]
MIILEGAGSSLRASAVKVIKKDSSTREFMAEKEIIVSGGAYCLPHSTFPFGAFVVMPG